MFNITGEGFYVTYANEWTVSVQFGEFTNSDFGNTNAEVAAWDSDKNWYEFPSGDTVEGWLKPDEVLAFMNTIASFKQRKGTK
jgi:hypothetical protein|tara:strand:+ start:395 stop:643 length:249 start_codon:yes stop_codon:yes gene_type:complete